MVSRKWLFIGVTISLLLTAGPGIGGARANDYPTTVVTDYVIGCMASNGQNQDMLRRCSCSIDTVASIMPYETYEKADTIMRMQQVSGEMTSMFRDMKMLTNIVKQLRLAQIEADFRCF
jgi:hypothetical protein